MLSYSNHSTSNCRRFLTNFNELEHEAFPVSRKVKQRKSSFSMLQDGCFEVCTFLDFCFILFSSRSLLSVILQRAAFVYALCIRCSSRSTCISTQSDLRATCTLFFTLYLSADSVALRSDCLDVHADLKLQWQLPDSLSVHCWLIK